MLAEEEGGSRRVDAGTSICMFENFVSDFSEERGEMKLQKWKISFLSHLKPSQPR